MSEIALNTGFKYSELLVNNTDNGIQQKKLNKNLRIDYSKNKYRVISSDIGKECRILLIDDLTTTGSTIRACIKALEESGYSNIKALTWFNEF